MKYFTLAASAFALSIALPATAQMSATANTGMMTSADVGVSPMSGVSATDYVKLAADSDNYEIQSSRIALSRSKRDDVKGYAREMIADHMGTTKSLMAALVNSDRKIAKPSMILSSDNAAKVMLLKKAPKASFDDLYIQQQTQSHQTAWALHKGYATEGTDAALKQVASTAVPIVERHFGHVKGMTSMAMGAK